MSISFTIAVTPGVIGNLTASRLDKAIRAICPIDGVAIGNTFVRLDTKEKATAAEQAAAIEFVSTFPWTQAADDAHAIVLSRAAVISRMSKKGDDTAMAMRALMKMLNASLNELRTQAGLPTKTLAETMAKFATTINNGEAD